MGQSPKQATFGKNYTEKHHRRDPLDGVACALQSRRDCCNCKEGLVEGIVDGHPMSSQPTYLTSASAEGTCPPTTIVLFVSVCRLASHVILSTPFPRRKDSDVCSKPRPSKSKIIRRLRRVQDHAVTPGHSRLRGVSIMFNLALPLRSTKDCPSLR